MPESRRLGGILVIGLALAALACGPRAAEPAAAPGRAAGTSAQASAPPSPAGSAAADVGSAEWQALVRAAEDEGRIVIYGAPGQEWREFLAGAFGRTYPRITVEYYG